MEIKNMYTEVNQKLVDGCRKNKRSAQIRIYELYYKAMYNTSLRILNNREEAEDIMQEAFLDAFKKIDLYKGTGSFGAWLKRIVVNKSIDHLRAKKDTLSLEEEIIAAEDVEDTTIEDEAYVSNTFTRLEEIREAIDNLDAHHKIVISLHLLEGYDHQEIAQILHTSHNNARARYFRAKKKLLEEIIRSGDAYLKSLTN
ncbi:MAG: sigma-70 family RNA polymerase sigma factor [Bacteroidetes bacterium]|nr:sigma-70 family RNA polymerase sigma factor [Bacteroidota bacterium]